MSFQKLPALVLLTLFFAVQANFAQVLVRNTILKSEDPTLTGKIVDGETGEPVEFATISILNEVDSALVTGGVTNFDGEFKIKAAPGEYVIKISFVSYETKVIGGINVTSTKPTISFGEIVLNSEATALAEVEVVGERSRLQMDLDKRVFVVEKDLSNIGGSASDMLDNIPSVMVDAEGNVSLRGNNNVRILINGQQSGMLGIDGVSGLRSLPANMIESVEVVTNPSARYDAEGNAGVINIILRKNWKQGFNGNFDFSLGFPERYNAAINLNYRLKDFNFFVNYGLSYRSGPGRGFTRRDFTINDVFNRLDQTSNFNRTGLSNTIRFGADYSFNDKNTLTGSFMYRISDDENFADVDFREYDINNTPIGARFRDAIEVEDESNLEYAINYKREFGRKGHELIASINYNEGPETELSDITDQVLDPFTLDPDFGATPLLQRSDNTEDQSNLVFQADYIQPMGEKAKLELGVKSSIRNISNDYLVEERNGDTGEYERLNNLSNRFVYDENIHAAYVIYSNKLNRFTYQAGLRTEITDIATNLLDTEERNSKNYANFFPSAHITYDLLNGNSMQVSYSRRLRRPSFRYLIPFFNYFNPQNIRAGNPDLDPEFTDAYEVAYIKNWEKATLTSSAYYRRSQGVVEWISRVDEAGVTNRNPENLPYGLAYGLEFIIDKEMADWWNVNGSFNFFRNIIDGGAKAVELDQDLSADTYTWMSRINSRMTLPGKIEFQTMLNYRAPMETTQGRRKSITSMDIGFTKDIIKKKATLSVRVSDVFNSRKYQSEISGKINKEILGQPYKGFFSQESMYQRRVRSFIMNFSYRLNQKKSRKRGGRKRGDDGGFDGM